jgi:outer membrane protein assembly factor BamB
MTFCSGARGEDLRGQIISNELAGRYGLRRAWLTQARLDPAVDHVVDLRLDGNGLFLLSKRGLMQMLDAETGATGWVVQFGNPLHPSMGPGVGEQYVAMTNGSNLFVVQRSTGKLVFQKSLQHIPSAAPAVLGTNVYVPLFNGMLSTYDLNRPHSAPWYYRSAGTLNVPPLATTNVLAWATSAGNLYGSSSDRLAVRFQFQTSAEISAPLAYSSPYLFAASRDGFVYAVNEQNGRALWRFAAGDAVSQQPTVIGENVFVVPESGGMYCLSSKTGLPRWFAARVSRFVAASPKRPEQPAAPAPTAAELSRIYAADETGNLMILDADSGARLDTMPANQIGLKFTNSENDRIYLASPAGLIQCLHELGLARPTNYAAQRVAKPAPPEGQRPAPSAENQPSEAPAEESEANPFE